MKILILMAGFFYSSIALAGVGVTWFHADGTPVLDIDSNTVPISGKSTIKAGKLSGLYKVDLRSFETDIERRDDHMQKMLETDKFPFAKFHLEAVKIGKPGKFRGSLALHGVTKKIEGKVKFKDAKTASFSFDINTSDFKLKRAFYEIITVGEIVNVNVTLRF